MPTSTEFPKLYKLDENGSIVEWSIRVQDHSTIVTRWGREGGQFQEARDVVLFGKNIGKKNETDPVEQACRDAKSKWKKQQKARKYVVSREAALAGERSELVEGGVDPMLAFPIEKKPKALKYPCYVQPKLDGHRCIAVIKGGKTTLWSRTRKPINSVPHIVAALEKAFEGVKQTHILDGELYVHPNDPRGVQVPLTQGAVALVDEEDAALVNAHSWHLSGPGYAAARIDDVVQYLHRVLLQPPDGYVVDHINHNKLDNRRSNLRICSQQGNLTNAGLSSANTSGYRGVSRHKDRWQVKIRVDRVQMHVGYFDSLKEAGCAYDEAAKKYFGEFANANAERLTSFENLTSAIRASEPSAESALVSYHIYDLANVPWGFDHRHQWLSDYLGGVAKPLVLVETKTARDEEELQEQFQSYLEQGYEGLMARNAGGLYEGKRSANLLKVKEMVESEFGCVGVEEGRGKLAGHAIFVFETKDGKKFNAKMVGEQSNLKRFFDFPEQVVGKLVTVKYQSLTSDGLPRFPVALRIRVDL